MNNGRIQSSFDNAQQTGDKSLNISDQQLTGF
jgi:hypothetical protein